MTKVILLSDKEQLPKGAFEFACMLQEQAPLLLVGVFLPKVDYWDTRLYYTFGAAAPWIWGAPGPDGADPAPELAMEQFRQMCGKNGIEYRVHDKEYDDVKLEISKESRFADLLLFSDEAFERHLDDLYSEEYSEHALQHAECPVLVVPERFEQPDNIILAYDGTASSVYAIRQAAALMPGLASELETLLVYVDPDERSDFPDKAYIEELAARHFLRLTMQKLEIEPEKYFSTWLSHCSRPLLVTGAQGRSGLSRIFRKSFIGELLRERQYPIFIAHR